MKTAQVKISLIDIGYKMIDKIGMPHVVEYIRLQLSDYDTTQLDWIKLLPLRKTTLLHGECTFPGTTPGRRVQHGYRIRASVNVEMAPPFSYEHWGRIASTDSARGWISGEQTFYFADLEECAVHTLSHECFHFLRDSGQLNLKNTEANANWWGDQWLERYKKLFD
ncbi:MAG TPA: hypothetical protein DGR97_14155 [Gammaproteobacteria bacterium]|nr:hypothetical protein [Gammaproteobacteria bacterium]